MSNLIGEVIYENRSMKGLLRTNSGLSMTSPAGGVQVRKGYVKPSLDLWLRMAVDFNIPEKTAV
jgi:hypothetical protein